MPHGRAHALCTKLCAVLSRCRQVRVMNAPAESTASAAPALQVLCSLSPIYNNNPVFYTARLSAVTHRFEQFFSHTLNLATVEEFPTFVQRPVVAPAIGMSNAAWKALIDTWHTPVGDATFVDFFEQYKGGHHGRGNACTDVADVFQDCLTCTEGCRTAFACLCAHGLNASDYHSCLAMYGS